ncbi:hypothetical protein TWF225_008100 [Orbilia oligospora]|nr:hypothetical protein TWF225_008100 [Orbilia oligospora]KAF3236909.1 hypothetical protein TWF217_002445 [Orbilia oligospora]KAF3261310.1 hypothetical protein TWF128_003091 [Orbilia oligospora]
MRTPSASIPSSLNLNLNLNISDPSKLLATKYPAKSHARRTALALNLKEGLIYLSGEVSRNNEDSDMPAVFRQKRYFFYLTGYDLPDGHVTYDIGTDTLTLWILRPDPKEKLWSGPSPTPKTLLQTHDIDMANYTSSLPTTLQAYTVAHPAAKIHIIHHQYPPIPTSLYQHCTNHLLKPALDVSRVIKDAYEIELIKVANQISTHAHLKIMALVDTFTTEREIEAEFISETIKRGGKLAYDTIACSGRNCSILHYVRNDQPLRNKQLILLDAGAEYNLYASDVTRTFPISGTFSKEAKEIYTIVYKMQKKVFSMLKPGVKWRDCHFAAVDVAIEGLKEIGLLVGKKEDILASQVLGKVFFPHGLGHHVGLETHDVLYYDLISASSGGSGDNVDGGMNTTKVRMRKAGGVITIDEFDAFTKEEIYNHLKPGMTLTVEPGIYFNQPLYEDYLETFPSNKTFVNETVLSKYWDVGGVRIEDVVLITEDGYENLTPAPKEIIDIERITSCRARSVV